MQLLTVETLAERLSTTKHAIYNRVQRGQIPGVVRFGTRQLRFREDVIAEWIEAQTETALSNEDWNAGGRR